MRTDKSLKKDNIPVRKKQNNKNKKTLCSCHVRCGGVRKRVSTRTQREHRIAQAAYDELQQVILRKYCLFRDSTLG